MDKVEANIEWPSLSSSSPPPEYDITTITSRLIETHKQGLLATEQYDKFLNLFNKNRSDIELYKQALESISEIIAVIEGHIKLNETLQNECLPHELDAMIKNRQWLVEKRDETIAKRTEIERNLTRSMFFCRSTEQEMNSLKPNINRLQKERDSLQIMLHKAGIPTMQIERILQKAFRETSTREVRISERDEDSSCNYVEVEIMKNLARKESSFHEVEANWLVQDCDRNDAEKLLAGRCSGTFLIRNSRRGQYALSVVVDNKVYHCLIHNNERGFGFAEPYDIHPTLKSLVLHYSQTSLEEHNDTLHTTLAYPVFADIADESTEAYTARPQERWMK